MLTKKRRKEIERRLAKWQKLIDSGMLMRNDTEVGFIRDLLAHIEELEAENRIMHGQLAELLPQYCDEHEVKLVIKRGRLYCPKGHEINVG